MKKKSKLAIAILLAIVTLLSSSKSVIANNGIMLCNSNFIKVDSAIPVPSSGNLPGTNS